MTSTSGNVNGSPLPNGEISAGAESYLGAYYTSTTHHAPYTAIASLPTDLTGRVVFISGATSILGRAAALALVNAGVKGLVLTAREGKVNVLDEIADAVLHARADDKKNVEVLKVTLDVLSPSSITAAVSRVRDTFGTIDTLLNISARIDSLASLSTSDPDDWWSAVETNLKGTWSITQAVLPLLKESKAETKWIVNYASTGAFSSSPFCSGYCISKLAVLRLTEMLHNELSSSGSESKITVIAAHPGAVISPLTEHVVPPEYRETIVDTPELSAESIVWLIKERRGWLSGRFVSCTWDLPELERKKMVVEKHDLLKMTLRL